MSREKVTNTKRGSVRADGRVDFRLVVCQNSLLSLTLSLVREQTAGLVFALLLAENIATAPVESVRGSGVGSLFCPPPPRPDQR